MGRQSFLITLVFVLSVVGRVCAEEPRPSDVEACKEDASTAHGTPAASADRPARDTTTSTGEADKSHDGASASPPMKHDDSPASARERQAFAACLARHGYYKGYYH